MAKQEIQSASQQTQELRRKRWIFWTRMYGTKIRRRVRANSCDKRVFERQALINAEEITPDSQCKLLADNGVERLFELDMLSYDILSYSYQLVGFARF